REPRHRRGRARVRTRDRGRGRGLMLDALAALVDGTVSDGRLRGSYEGYGVAAWSTNERPAPDVPAAQGGTRSAGPKVNVFHLRLIGVPRRHFWDCRSTPSLLGNAALVL